jgi:hypothetical protein
MVRKQLYIEPEQDRLLKDLASLWHVTEAEVVRYAIALLKHAQPPDEVRLRAWEEIKAFSRERAKINVPQTERKWKREDAYTGPRFDWELRQKMLKARPPDDAVADR